MTWNVHSAAVLRTMITEPTTVNTSTVLPDAEELGSQGSSLAQSYFQLTQQLRSYSVLQSYMYIYAELYV